jgi:hypothetical protein
MQPMAWAIAKLDASTSGNTAMPLMSDFIF